MDQLGFQGGGTGASDRAESMQGAVEMNCYHEAVIQYPRYGLPEYLKQLDAVEVAVTLWDQDNGLTGALLRKVTLMEGGLDQTFELLPENGIRYSYLVATTI